MVKRLVKTSYAGERASKLTHLKRTNEVNDMWYKSSKKHKCEDCIHCDIKTLKCYPQSRDCHSEYDLTEEDLHNLGLCDFFKHK